MPHVLALRLFVSLERVAAAYAIDALTLRRLDEADAALEGLWQDPAD